ncbi:sensor histidine kinase [Mucilaginibacter myungsuensis]|uniref:histidine kinase n=1 Tax=Mucilaginibacter myungsuensis TaxID=649104 RepID=A0A929KVQ0_9SPHI|nr:HAMP domain-containing sensor histidine kinase [Mucilaginibacter myungsuensis]MBE9662471.1 HAMP domain-containing histidine kinase [Mucilaginibacter myungsuensis]MDN3597891.1 HAMP domain-containing sensor histidine kinase [Mucilaginibacter myungsuensis]
MTVVVIITLENEMDLVLAHKRSMKVAEKVGLTTATQTTFATAVSEIARTVIEHTNDGVLNIGLEQNKQRYTLIASVSYGKDIRFNNGDAGYFYAQKLVPEFVQTEETDHNKIDMKFGIPRSLKLDPSKISGIKHFFGKEQPINAYDEIKQRNASLSQLAVQKEEELRQSRIIDEKKTEFISIASHEIKTPITIIKAYTQVAMGLSEQCSVQVKAILEKVDTQTTKLMSLVQQLLDISKIENGNLQYIKEEVELNGFVAEMADIIRHIYPNHDISTRLCDGLPVNIDRIRMEQVFSNLIGNAAKYSKKGTKIVIRCSKDIDGMAKITVTDHGIGMSPATMELIFNKFYRDKDVIKTHSGLGMGLYVASKIVADHGGRIWVDSEDGKGSSFYFTIPLTS